MTRTRIVLAPHAVIDPPRYLLLDAAGAIVGRGEAPIAGAPPLTPTRDILVIPGVDAVARWLHLPIRNDRQARAAAELQLGDQAIAGEDLHFALGPLATDGRRLVVTIGRGVLQAHINTAALHGVTPEVIIPDHLALTAPVRGEPPVATAFGPALAVRGEDLAVSLDPDLAPMILRGQTPRLLEVGELDAMFTAMAAAPAINLAQGAFGPAAGLGSDLRSGKRLAVLAVLGLLSPLVLMGAGAVRHDLAARRIEAETRAQVAAILPRGQTVKDPTAQAAAYLEARRLSAGGGPVGLAAVLFATLETLDQAQLESVMLTPDGSLRAQISSANVSDIEVIRGAMKGRAVGYREDAVREENGRVISDIVLGMRS